MSNRQLVRYDLGDFTVAGVVATIFAQDFRNAIFDFQSIAASDATIKFVASKQTAKPDFSSAASKTNDWVYVQAIDLNDGSSITGSTGYTFSGVSSKQFEINTNAEQWVGVVITARTAGGFSCKVALADNL